MTTTTHMWARRKRSNRAIRGHSRILHRGCSKTQTPDKRPMKTSPNSQRVLPALPLVQNSAGSTRTRTLVARKHHRAAHSSRMDYTGGVFSSSVCVCILLHSAMVVAEYYWRMNMLALLQAVGRRGFVHMRRRGTSIIPRVAAPPVR